MGGAPTPQWDPIGFDPQGYPFIAACLLTTRMIASVALLCSCIDLGSTRKRSPVSFPLIGLDRFGSLGRLPIYPL